MVICLKQGAKDLHMVQLMPLPPSHLMLRQNLDCCRLKIQIGSTFVAVAYPDYPGKEAVKWVSVT